MAPVTHTSEARQSPKRAGPWDSAVPPESRATYPLLSRVRDVHIPMRSCLGMEGERNVLDVSSAPTIPGAYVPETVTKEALRTGATQGVEEMMNQGPLVSRRCVLAWLCPALCQPVAGGGDASPTAWT